MISLHTHSYSLMELFSAEPFTPLLIKAEDLVDIVKTKDLLAKGAELPFELIATAIRERPKDILQVMIATLVERGQGVDLQNKHGTTPLMYAAKLNRLSELELLLEAKASCTLADTTGSRALHYAADHASPEIADALTQAGASLSAVDCYGYTPLLHAKSSNNSRFYQHIKRLDDKVYTYSKEYYRRMRLAHICKISGTTTLPHPATSEPLTLKLEGWYPKEFIKVFSKRIKRFFAQHAGTPPGIDTKAIVEMLDFAIQTPLADTTSIVNQYKTQNKPVCLSTGYIEHHSTFLLWNRLLIICDRAKQIDFTIVPAVEIDPEKVDKDFIAKIGSLRNLDENEYNHFIINTLPSYQATTSQKSIAERINALLKLPFLEIDTCAWDNTETCIFALFILQAVYHNETLANEKQATDDQLRLVITALFTEWQEYVTMYETQKYLTHIKSLDSSLLDNDFLQKLQRPEV